MKAVVLQEDRSCQIQEKDVPSIAPNQILVRNTCFGINPSDWKHAAWSFLANPGVIMGCDSVGVVDKIGSAVPSSFTHIGERRGIFMRGGTKTDNGPFAEYTAINHDLTFALPSNVSDEAAATIPACFFTATQILYGRMDLPDPGQQVGSDGPWILVWSGATSVGQFVIQLAHASGCKVVTTSSKDNWDYLKTLGADLCFDYKDPQIVEHIRAEVGDAILYGVDCFSEQGSVELCYDLMSTSKPSHLVTVLTLYSPPTHNSNLKLEATMLYSALGEDVDIAGHIYKTNPDEQAHHRAWLKKAPKIFEQGQVKPLKYRDMGDLSNINEGLAFVRDGKIKGEKLVYTSIGNSSGSSSSGKL